MMFAVQKPHHRSFEGSQRRIVRLLALVICTLMALLGYDLMDSRRNAFETQQRDQANLGDVIERHIQATVGKVDIVL